MKIKINKNLRIVLIFTMVILTGIISFLLYDEMKNPDFKEEKISLYSYNQQANVNYRVFLKPNILYNRESLEEGNIYITEFADSINTFFTYEFSGERPVDIKGDYEIVGEIEGYTIEEESQKTIWKKTFQFLPKTSFASEDKTISIKKSIPLKFQEYNDFAKQVIEDSKIGSQVKMTVSMHVNVKAKTDHGVIEEKMSPSIIIPLNKNYFEIMGNLNEEKPGNIEETKQIQLPINKKIVMLYGVILGVVFIAFMFLVFFTKGIIKNDPFEKKLKKIFKNHGDRLVALNNEVALNCENHNRVKSIDDLVRIADEIGKPIMYKYSPNLKDMTEFYVFEDTKMYIYDLKNMLLESNSKALVKEGKKSKGDGSKLRKKLSKFKSKSVKEEESETEKQI